MAFALLALVLHALGLLALLAFGLLALLLSSLGFAIGALLVGRLVTLLTILVILAAFLLHLLTLFVGNLSGHRGGSKSHKSERQ